MDNFKKAVFACILLFMTIVIVINVILFNDFQVKLSAYMRLSYEKGFRDSIKLLDKWSPSLTAIAVEDAIWNGILSYSEVCKNTYDIDILWENEKLKLEFEKKPLKSNETISDIRKQSPVLPVNSYLRTSKYGFRKHPLKNSGGTTNTLHNGVDIYSKGSRIFSVLGGEVHKVSYSADYGNYIVLKHSDNFKTLYAHLSKITVRKGQQISKNYPMGVIGNTGLSTGEHLHFEVIIGGTNVNPEEIF